MAKRPHEEDVDEGGAPTAAPPKKPRHGFRVGPENLPDGPWRRKLAKVKKELIHQAKIKKKYAKIKARAQQEGQFPTTRIGLEKREERGEEEDEEEKGQVDDAHKPQLHPDRQAMLSGGGGAGEATDVAEEKRGEGRDHQQRQHRRRQQGRHGPDYFQRALAEAERRKAEAAARAEQARKHEEERARKTAERERMRRAMANARRPVGAGAGSGQVGQRKLGRESGILLDKVKKLVGEGRRWGNT